MKVLVLGAGQLARMMSLAGAPLGIEVSAYDVVSEDIVHPLTKTALGHGLGNAIASAQIITAEFEHIPHAILDQCEASGKLHPSAQAIKTGGDRRIEKSLLDKAGVANATYEVVNNREDFDRAVAKVGLPMVLKSAKDGYDGKGQWRLKSEDQKEPVWQEIAAFLAAAKGDQSIVAEAFVPFDYEVSLIGVRNMSGELEVYPLTENTHVDGVLNVSVAGNQPMELQAQAKAMFRAVAEALDYVGVLAIEFFVVGEKLLVNEIAPRVHNSGHWSQQGAETCQFENHLRAVTGMPLGRTTLLRPTAMVNILGEDTLPEAVYTMGHVHWYGKEKRTGRKMGHINLCANTLIGLGQVLDAVAPLAPAHAREAVAASARKLAG
ncbi:5-(carboxyamino)imidazole ribonucleotide synthase [Parasalinivibrio latis]|uniref:5-(carboxyamino)imidazole ribonucleotide synthase n=1 Tax=Parasalinivibrio latis TaxID=2952610 RepID=UPI0030E1BF3A